nr:4Fe-4S ferredoxin [Vallitaleaceae bacterium]
MKKYDERDTMFARMSLEYGSVNYNRYYAMRPELKEADDILRSKPGLLSEGTATYDPIRGPFADANFSFMNHIMDLSAPKVHAQKVDIDPANMTNLIKGMITHYGAGSVGITKMTDDMYYSHRGRREHYGKVIERDDQHMYGIAFTIPMAIDLMMCAPGLPEVIEVSNAYLKAAIIGMQISYYIASLGYGVRNHMDANYLVVAPRVARMAGLGAFGRQGLIITPEYGPNVRLGVITTDMPLELDAPLEFDPTTF